MSKTVGAHITCAECNHKFEVQLYRSLWIDSPAPRALLFHNKVNRFECAKCHWTIDTCFPFLAVNAQRQVAVWYEPSYDPAIDEDVANYRRHMGPTSFYAVAPRIADWEAFKDKIIELEEKRGASDLKPKLSPEIESKLAKFLRAFGKKK